MLVSRVNCALPDTAKRLNPGKGVFMPAQYFFVQLLGTRSDWPNAMTPAEEQVMAEHFTYLQKLVAQHKVLMAGPVFEDVFGLIVLSVSSREEAESIMAQEPSVVRGVHTFTMRPMQCS